MTTKPRDNPFANFDYRVECDDFLLYELARLIDEDSSSIENSEFLRVIEAGIHEHIERRLQTRADLAKRVRESGAARDLVRALEDIEAPLSHIPQVIYGYTGYLFGRLDECSANSDDERITTAADTLFDSPDDRTAAEAAIDLLGSIRSAVSARILAHAVSEPMLDEDLEAKAYQCVREMWPLARPYVLYSLKPHNHEDIPFRWFQLMIECDEPSAVERILEEVVVHGTDSNYREDLVALVQLLEHSSDPETEDKILQVLNSNDAPKSATGILEGFIKSTKAQRHKDTKADSPWASLGRVYTANRKYLDAARLFDAGKKAEAARTIEELVKDEPQYPFALMLKQMMK
jgi:hypothetical protein